jgi:hypothetical protein
LRINYLPGFASGYRENGIISKISHNSIQIKIYAFLLTKSSRIIEKRFAVKWIMRKIKLETNFPWRFQEHENIFKSYRYYRKYIIFQMCRRHNTNFHQLFMLSNEYLKCGF